MKMYHSNMTEDKKELKEILDENSRISIENQLIDYIIQVCCKYYDTTYDEVKTKKRTKEIVKVRQVIMYLIQKNSRISLYKIGTLFNKDHATVIHSRKIIDGYRQFDKVFRKEMDELQNIINLKASSFTNDVTLENDFYFIDLNNYYSIKIDRHKAIILSGYTLDEVSSFMKRNRLKSDIRKHTNKGSYILEKANNENSERKEAQGETSQQQD